MKNRYYSFDEFTITTVSKEHSYDLGIPLAKLKKISNRIKLDIERIESYEQAILATLDFDEENLVYTEITMQSGTKHLVNISYNELDLIINSYYTK